MNRGSHPQDAGRRRGHQGFNEAPIHESGKYFGNEAHSNSGRPASMRPRFMNRGSWRPRTCRARRWLGFNEAPIHESGKFGRDPAAALVPIALQ